MRFLEPGDPAAIARSVAHRFAEAFGRDASHVAMAPGRVNLIGEHLDYNGGLCLPIALPHATWAALAPREDGRLRMASAQQDGVVETHVADLSAGSVTGWASYVAGVVWALSERGYDVAGLDVLVDSTVPVGAGLSSSAALECSVAVALAELLGIVLDDRARLALAADCVRAETEMAGAPTGGLDQAAAMSGRAGHALLLDFGDGSRHQVEWSPESAGLRVLVIDTRASHELVDGGYGSRREACEAACRILGVTTLREVADRDAADRDAALASLPDEEMRRRVRHVFTETELVREAVNHVESGDWAALGEVFGRSHASMRDDYEISCDELDVAVSEAAAAGALGARMTGGGFGGSAIALVPTERTDDVVSRIDSAYDERGWPRPYYLDAVASDGARGLRRA